MRLLEPVLERELREGLPSSGDDDLAQLVAQAEAKFLDPDPAVSRDALEKLWDAFERAKSLLDPAHKQRSAHALAEASTTTEAAIALVESEMLALTNVGNDFRIRHHETTKHPVPNDLVDHLFLRLYVLLRLLLTGLEDLN